MPFYLSSHTNNWEVSQFDCEHVCNIYWWQKHIYTITFWFTFCFSLNVAATATAVNMLAFGFIIQILISLSMKKPYEPVQILCESASRCYSEWNDDQKCKSRAEDVFVCSEIFMKIFIYMYRLCADAWHMKLI